MKTPSIFCKHTLILLLPLLAVLASGLVFLRDDGNQAGAGGIRGNLPAAARQTVAAAGKDTPDKTPAVHGAPTAGKNGQDAVADLKTSPLPVPALPAMAAVVPITIRSWTLRADPVPVAHWAPGTGGPAPQRSGRLEGGLQDLEKAVAGTPMEFPLFDGLTAQGIVRRAVETAPGERLWSGKLSQPAGKFFIEHNQTG